MRKESADKPTKRVITTHVTSKYTGAHARLAAAAGLTAEYARCGRKTGCQACADRNVAVVKARQEAGKKLRTHRKTRLLAAAREIGKRLPVWSMPFNP